MEKLWTDDAWNEYLYWQEHDKKTLKRINALVKDIERNGTILMDDKKPPRLERLFYALYSLFYWSRLRTELLFWFACASIDWAAWSRTLFFV